MEKFRKPEMNWSVTWRGENSQCSNGRCFRRTGFAVDTHVERVSKRLRICKLNANVTEVEQTLMRKVPKELWVKTHHTMIFFGRYHCLARAPKCEACPLLYMCQEGKERMKGK